MQLEGSSCTQKKNQISRIQQCNLKPASLLVMVGQVPENLIVPVKKKSIRENMVFRHHFPIFFLPGTLKSVKKPKQSVKGLEHGFSSSTPIFPPRKI